MPFQRQRIAQKRKKRKTGTDLIRTKVLPSEPHPFTFLSLLLWGLLFGLPVSCSPEPKEYPNLVLVVIDALRPDHTGIYGNQNSAAPHLDVLAQEAIVFKNAVAQAAFTLPSMATLFTSLNPPSHGVRRHLDPRGMEDRLEPSFTTLAEILKQEGFATGAVVSNSLFTLPIGFDQGFDYFNPGRRRDAGPTTDAAIDWLDAPGEKKPFFLWVHYIDPHWPYAAPHDFERPFFHEDQGRFQRMVRDFEQGRLPPDRIYFNEEMDPDVVLRGKAEYANEIAYADFHLHRLIAHLKRKEIYDDTVIVVVSDHGESLGEHGLFFAHSFYLYEEIQKVLFLLKPPEGGKGVVVEEPVRLLDLLPTVLSLLGVEGTGEMEGRDLCPCRTGKKIDPLPAYAESEPRYRNKNNGFRYAERKRALVEGNEGKWRMIRYKDRKLIVVPEEGVELYDLAVDPKERTNIAAKEPETVKALKAMLIEIMEKERKGATSGEGPSEEAQRLIREMGY